MKKNRGRQIWGTPKWMVKIMENPMNKLMIWGVFPLFLVQHPYAMVFVSSFFFAQDLASLDFMGLKSSYVRLPGFEAWTKPLVYFFFPGEDLCVFKTMKSA